MSTPPLVLRPAELADSAALAELLLQLYHVELPGVLHGPRERQGELLSFIVEAGGMGGFQGRYVALDEQGRPIATGALRLPGDRMPAALPPHTIRTTLRLLGARDAARLFGTLLRSIFFIEGEQPRDTAYLHSIVVAEQMRRRGIGEALVTALEQQAAQQQMRAVQLRVIVGNAPARRLYERMGYRTVARTPRWLAPLTYPTELMVKRLD